MNLTEICGLPNTDNRDRVVAFNLIEGQLEVGEMCDEYFAVTLDANHVDSLIAWLQSQRALMRRAGDRRPPQHHSVFVGEWWSHGVLKPPMVREYPETTAWRAEQVANGARVLTTDEWLALHPELLALAPREEPS